MMFDDYRTMGFDDPITGKMTSLHGLTIPPAVMKEAPKASKAQVALPPSSTTSAAPLKESRE